MKIAYLGAGTWGFCLASLLAAKGHLVVSWTKRADLAKRLNSGQDHPHLPGHKALPKMHFTTDLSEALSGAEMIVEGVTAAGIRLVFEQVKEIQLPTCPIVITSKGIEQNTGLILPEVAVEVFGEETRSLVGCLSGPGYAEEVIKGLPTSVVGSAFNAEIALIICEAFTNQLFRVYPNTDIRGVAYGGALKNIIAIACGISEGLSLGYSSKAALMTRGLHEIAKLAILKGCKEKTIYGLSGMGDVCLTCGSMISRNSRFGFMLAQGKTPAAAEKEIGMVVEGIYTSLSVLQLSQKEHVVMPITETIYDIIYKGLRPLDAVQMLMQRTIKEEQL